MPDTEPLSSSTNSITALKHEVQRKLGRCMLRVQQYERLMKAILAGMAREGTPATIESTLTDKAAEVGAKSLGILLENYFLKEFLLDSSKNSHQIESAGTSAESQAIAAELPYVKARFQIRMATEDFEQTKQALLTLRDLRNSVVHHLLDRFDIHTESGCLAAIAYLDESYVTFDAHWLQLRQWAEGMERAHSLSASFLASQVFEDLVVNGINPDGSVEWPASGVVQALREAEVACAKDGWTLLDSAIAWLSADHSDQTPTKYQCKTWKQVLERSKQFETRTAVDPVNNRGQTWFRSSAVV